MAKFIYRIRYRIGNELLYQYENKREKKKNKKKVDGSSSTMDRVSSRHGHPKRNKKWISTLQPTDVE